MEVFEGLGMVAQTFSFSTCVCNCMDCEIV